MRLDMRCGTETEQRTAKSPNSVKRVPEKVPEQFSTFTHRSGGAFCPDRVNGARLGRARGSQGNSLTEQPDHPLALPQPGMAPVRNAATPVPQAPGLLSVEESSATRWSFMTVRRTPSARARANTRHRVTARSSAPRVTVNVKPPAEMAARRSAAPSLLCKAFPRAAAGPY